MKVSYNLKDLHHTEYAVKKVTSEQLRLAAVSRLHPPR